MARAECPQTPSYARCGRCGRRNVLCCRSVPAINAISSLPRRPLDSRRLPARAARGKEFQTDWPACFEYNRTFAAGQLDKG